MPSNYLTGYAPDTQIGGATGTGTAGTSGQYAGMDSNDLLQYMYSHGLTQEGVNRLYQIRNIGQAPTLPANLIGAKRQATKGGAWFYGTDGKPVRTPEAAAFTHTLNSQVVDPYREYNVGNWLGVAGMLAGGYGAGQAIAAGADAANAGSAASNLGYFSNGGTGGIGGLGGGAAGDLAASGAITGGAGVGGTTAGALGGFSPVANTISGVGAAGAAGGGSMGWWDTALDLLPVAASIYSGSQQRDAAGDASRAEQAGVQAGIDEQRRQFDTILGLTKPQRDLGNSAIGVLNQLGGYNTGPDGAAGTPNMGAFTASPDYQFRRDEGTRDINNSFAARGGALSGNALRGITDFNSNLASGEFNNFVQRRLQEAGLGGAATSQTASAAQYTGGNVANLLNQGGNARASGIINQSNATTGGLNDLATWYGNWRKSRGG